MEAKSHLGETPYPDSCDATDPHSIKLINESLAKARLFYGIPPNISPWTAPYYQVCNRLGHLYWMNEIVKVNCWLVWFFITDDSEWEDRANILQWRQYLGKVYREIGLPWEHRLKERVLNVFAPPLE